MCTLDAAIKSINHVYNFSSTAIGAQHKCVQDIILLNAVVQLSWYFHKGGGGGVGRHDAKEGLPGSRERSVAEVHDCSRGDNLTFGN